jgi:hypothetical protein
MAIEMIDFDKLEQEQAEAKAKEKAIQSVAQTSDKSIADVSLKDVKFRLNTNQTYEEQAKDVVNVIATVKAVEDEATVQALAKGKQDELIGEQQSKVKKTQKDFINAQTEVQKAEYDSNKALFDTFNIISHLPKWLQMIVVPLLTPFYLIGVLVIKVPCGFVRMLIDGVDGIICRYEKADERTRPRIKVTIWIIFGIAIATAITLGILGGLKII